MAENVTDLNAIRQQVDQRKAEEQEKFGGGGGGTDDGLPSSFVRNCLDSNELGDGTLYAELHRGQYLYNQSGDDWLEWTGHHWTLDTRARHARRDVERVAQTYLQEHNRLGDELNHLGHTDEAKSRAAALLKQQSQILKRVSKLRSRPGQGGCLEYAAICDNPIDVLADELDNKPTLLACPNGVVDLKSGQLRDGRPEDYLHRATAVPYDPDADVKPWEDFLWEVYENEEKIAFLQQLFGYAIMGFDRREEVLGIFWGAGGNGKGVLFEIIKYCMGSLAGVIPADMLLEQSKQRNSSGPTPEIMGLKGLRIAIGSETGEGGKFSTERVKWLSGGDTLTGRSPHDKHSTEFPPTHTLFVQTNYLPHVSPTDIGFWRRAILIDHPHLFVDKPSAPNEKLKNPGLFQELKAHPSGPLRWMVEGSLAYWQAGGRLVPPDCVRQTTDQYRRDEDTIQDFIEAECVLGSGYQCGASDLYTRFSEWYESNVKKKVPSQQWFGKQLTQRNFEKFTSNGVKYKGIGLQSNDDRPMF